MYSTCVFCRASLGANVHVEHFPVARRVAFDPEQGRLWAVCAACGQWNLAPFEERWEALDECERLYRATRARVSTDQIGLARLGDGFELVRIGRPLRPEMAAWRFGAQFRTRQRKAMLRLGAGAAVAASVGAVAAGLASPIVLPVAVVGGIVAAALGIQRSPFLATGSVDVQATDGTRLSLDNEELSNVGLRPTDEPGEFRVAVTRTEFVSHQLPHYPRDWDYPAQGSWEVRHLSIEGEDAWHAARLLLPRVNAAGATAEMVEGAVASLEEAGSSEAYVDHAFTRIRAAGHTYSSIASYAPDVRLALEMSLHEETERRAMQGELALLERAWREAEQVASIADGLLVPGSVASDLARIKRGAPDARGNRRTD